MAVVPIVRAHKHAVPLAQPSPAATPFGATIAARGYQPNYRDGMDCPGCGRSAFHIGRQSAECAHCATALPLAPTRGAR